MSRNFCRTPPAPKTTAQVRRIFGLARTRGLDEADLHTLVEETTRKTSIRLLTTPEADLVIERLGGEAMTARRTVQHRRKQAGVEQLVPQGQLEKIADLAAGRNWSAEALQNFCRRQCGHFPLRTTTDANKVIEALKAMNRRDVANG